MSRCECGCGENARVGNRFIHGHSGRVPFGRGITHSDKLGRVFSDLTLGKEIGTILQKNPYDTFSSQEEACQWWGENHRTFMKEVYREYTSGGRVPGDRPQIFWEMSFGLFCYLTLEDRLFLLESHSLWWPKEKGKILADMVAENEGAMIPKTQFKGCLMHPCGYPIRWPFESSLKLEGGVWKRADCISSKMIYLSEKVGVKKSKLREEKNYE